MNEALRPVIDEVVLALAPLMEAVRAPEKMLWLLSELGWTPGSVPQPLADLATAGSDLVGLVGADPDATSTPEVFGAVGKLVVAIDEIRTMPDSAFPSGLDVMSFKATIGTDLLDYLLVEHLLSNHYSIAGPLLLAGFIRLVPQPASGLRQPYLRRQVMWSAAGETFEDPVRGFREAFDWNSSAPRLTAALGALGSLLEQAGLRFSYIRPADGLLAFVTAGSTDPAYDYLGIDVVFDTQTLDTTGFAAGLRLLVLSATASRGPAMGLLPYATLTEAVGVEVADNLTLSVQGDADFTKGIALVLAPGQPVALETGFLGGQATSPAAVNVKLTYTPPPGEPERVLVGTADGSRLSTQGLTLAAGATLISAGRIDAFVQLDLQNALVAIKPAPGEADSFIGSLLGEQGISAQPSFGLRLSSLTGFHLTGSDGLRAKLPADVQLGPVDIQAIELGLDTSGGDVSLEVGAAVAGTVGPLSILADGLGFTLTARFPSPPTGNLGPLDLALGYKPPSGLGLAIDAGVVTGAGFLGFDPARSEYRGAASLSIEDVDVSALGLVQTQPHVSFLLLIATTFPTPIQLGLGFSLKGVGGIAGINRSVSLDALEAAVWKGALKGVLFPTAPINDIAGILNELETLFPSAQGRYVFGPTAEILWMPPIVTGQVGLVLEVPDPIRLALFGSAIAQFPPDKPLVVLNVNFAGGIDFGTGRLFFDASLTGSRIEQYPITGDLSLRSSWFHPKSTALAVGGFNPHFQPPAGFPTLSRVSLDLSEGPLHFHLAAYLAITSNTFQVGAAVDLMAHVCDCDVAGHFAFDALFIKNPFSFIVDVDASASISFEGETFAGVHLSGTFSGPAPWHAKGSASISLLFVSVGVDFDHTWGSSAPASLPALDPWVSALAPALADPASWRGELSAGTYPVVTFVPDSIGGPVLLDPAAALVLDEKAVPLNQPIERFAESTLPTPVRFDLSAPAVNGTAVDPADWTPVTNEFAPAQCTEMTDDEKLSAESFVALPSGMAIGSTAASVGTSIGAALTYDLIILDSSRQPGPRVPVAPSREMQLASAASGPTARAPLRVMGLGRFAATPGAAPKASLADRKFSIVSTTNLASLAASVASSRYQAALALTDYMAQHAAPPASVQAVPLVEAA
jgi:hypothetical protein